MATKLNKDLVRETTINIDEKPILITLTNDQKISMKLKGQRGNPLVLPIAKLWNTYSESDTSKKEIPKSGMIDINDLRSMNLISTLSYEDKVKFDQLIIEVMENSN